MGYIDAAHVTPHFFHLTPDCDLIHAFCALYESGDFFIFYKPMFVNIGEYKREKDTFR